MAATIKTLAPAIKVTSATKKYGNNPVLEKLDMTVPSGITYALLGSSGCGKTTLFSCIVGLRRLSAGIVKLFGEDARNWDQGLIGFMPQEIGLHEELKVEEVLSYYGRLYGMKSSKIRERSEFLSGLLDIPSLSSFVHELSEGTKRRVSMGVALLHQPPLLILDEPTVGVDPLLRISIWNHLHKLVKEEGVTVVVSTHYTEEARQADILSIMRYGRLLVEESPTTLLRIHQTEFLEKIVIKLCRDQNLQESDLRLTAPGNPVYGVEGPNVVQVHEAVPKQPDLCLENKRSNLNKRKRWSFIHHLKAIQALFTVNMLTMLRHPLFLIILISIPLMNLVATWYIYDSEPVPDIGVVNLEQPNCFHLPLDQHKLGCEFLELLGKSEKLDMQPFSSADDALNEIHLGRRMGYILIPENFTTNMADRVAYGKFADSAILDGSTMSIEMDFSNFVKVGFFFKTMQEGLSQLVELKANQTNITGIEVSSTTNLSPFKINSKYSSLTTKWSHMVIIPCVLCFSFVMPTIIGVSLIWDKKRGVFYRSLVSGVGLFHIAIAGALTHLVLSTIGLSICLSMFPLFNVPFLGSLLDLYLLCWPEMLLGLTFGLFLGMYLSQELEVIFVILFFYMVTALTEGGVVPTESVNPWFRWFIYSLPLELPSNVAHNIMFKGWGLWPQVWTTWVMQGSWIVITFILASIAHYCNELN